MRFNRPFVALAQARRLSSTANNKSIVAVSKYPTRFRALSTLPMSSPEHVVRELVRATDLGHVGTMVYGRSGDRFLDDPAYNEFFAAAAELGQPVFIHQAIRTHHLVCAALLRGNVRPAPQLY